MIEFFYDKRFLFLLALTNFMAGIYSLTYYLPQLDQTTPLLWIFVADCPIFALLFGINVLLLIKEKPSAMLSLISIVGNIKYGLWTIFVFYLSGNLSLYWLFILSHFLLIIETIIFAKLFQFKLKHVFVAILFFLMNDFLDYVVGTHPLVLDEILQKVALFALISSVLLPIVLAVVFSGNTSSGGQKVHKDVLKESSKRGKWAKRL